MWRDRLLISESEWKLCGFRSSHNDVALRLRTEPFPCDSRPLAGDGDEAAETLEPLRSAELESSFMDTSLLTRVPHDVRLSCPCYLFVEVHLRLPSPRRSLFT